MQANVANKQALGIHNAYSAKDNLVEPSHACNIVRRGTESAGIIIEIVYYDPIPDDSNSCACFQVGDFGNPIKFQLVLIACSQVEDLEVILVLKSRVCVQELPSACHSEVGRAGKQGAGVVEADVEILDIGDAGSPPRFRNAEI